MMWKNFLKKRIVKEAAWIFLGQAGSAVLLLLGMRVLTELVLPSVYGEVVLFSGILAFIISIFSNPFVSAGIRFLPELSEKEQRYELRKILTILSRRSLVVAVFLLAIGVGLYTYISGIDPWVLPIVALLLIVTVHREFETSLLIALRRQKDASLWQTSDSLARPFFAVGLVLLGGANITMVLLGYALASSVNNALWSWIIHLDRADCSKNRKIHNTALERQLLTYAWPFIPIAILSWFNNFGDRYIIGYFMTPMDVGVYTAVYTLINEAFQRCATLFRQIFLPVYLQYYSTADLETAFKVLVIWLGSVIAMGIAGIVLLVLLKESIASLFLAQSYRDSATLMPMIGAGSALFALGSVLVQPLIARKNTKAILIGRICGTGMTILTVPLMVKLYGLIGAAAAAPIYFGIEAMMMILMAKPWHRSSPIRTQFESELNVSASENRG